MIGASRNLLEELDREGLSMVWLVQGEKRVSAGTVGGNQFGKSQIRSVYSLDDDGQFTGEMETDFQSWD